MTENSPKRFYKKVEVEPSGEKFAVLLDGRSIRTPMKSKLELPTFRLATAVSEEWGNQAETIELNTMPLTSFANTALDRVVPRRREVIDEISSYAETDLLCYRAEEPEDLVRRQEEEWQPHLDWLADTYGARLVPTSGIVHLQQDADALGTVRRIVGSRDDFGLTGLHVLTTGTGSVVLGLAVADGVVDARTATAAGQLDEIYQAEIWGEDPMSAERRAGVANDLSAAEHFLALLLAEA